MVEVVSRATSHRLFAGGARRRRKTGGLVTVLAVTAVLAGATGIVGASVTPSPPQLVTITIPAPPGEIPSKWLDYSGPPRANVLLPAGYDPHQRYPLLVLLNALENNYASYAENGIVAEAEAADLDAIVVMPEGESGWYTDWWNGGERGSPGWESYELNQVIPTVLAKYPILPQRQYHAIAGFSMGGLGAVYLGGRLPGFFGSVASLSGFDDLNYFPFVAQPGMALTSLAPFKGDFDFTAVDGPPGGFYLDGHDPALLAANLHQTRVFESTGTGIPSRAGIAATKQDNPGTTASIVSGSLLESTIIYPMNRLYHQALSAAGVDVTYEVHPGGHDLPDFYGEFQAMLAWGLFKPVVDSSTSWTNKTVATSGQLWDVGYQFAQPPTRVVQFTQSGTTLSVTAAGAAVTLTTSAGCTIHTATPATVQLPARGCP